MSVSADRAKAIIDAYNRKDFDGMERMMAPALDFAHFNRDFAISDRGELLGVLRKFAAEFIPDRRFEEPERVIEAGDIVIREGWYTGTPLVDLAGFGAQGEAFRLKFCSVMRFDYAGLLAEWKDYG